LKPFLFKNKIQTNADTITPVSVYLKYAINFQTVFLEVVIIMGVITVFLHLLQPIASIKIENETIYKTFPDGTQKNSYRC
jgi:anthranilate synthase component 1